VDTDIPDKVSKFSKLSLKKKRFYTKKTFFYYTLVKKIGSGVDTDIPGKVSKNFRNFIFLLKEMVDQPFLYFFCRFPLRILSDRVNFFQTRFFYLKNGLLAISSFFCWIFIRLGEDYG